MKIKPDHFQHIKKAIEDTIEKHGEKLIVDAYESGNFPRSDRVADLQKRFCFDLLYGSGLNSWACDSLYPYLNDDHIYTALKAICPKVTKNY